MATNTNKVVNIIPTFGTSTTNVSYSVDVNENEKTNFSTTSEEALINEHLDFIKKYVRLDTVGDNKINLVIGKTVVSVIDLSKLAAGSTATEFEITRDVDDPETVIVNVKDPDVDPNA